MLYLTKSINTAIEIYSVRLQPHQNPLAADLRILAMHCYGNAADFLRNPQRADSSENLRLQTHQNLLAPDLQVPTMLFKGKAVDLSTGAA